MTGDWHTADLDRFGAAAEVDITTVRPAKYARSGGSYVAAMTSDTARATTLRLTPR